MSTGPKSGWGGARPGSGPKRQTLSVRQVQGMLRTAKKYAKKHGKSIDEVLLDFVYAEDTSDKDRIACIKIFKEYTIAKIQEGGETDKALGPGIYLPTEKPDPSKVVPIKKAG